MTFKERLSKVLASLGLADKAKEQKLTPDDAAAIYAAYKKEFKSDLKTDLAAEKEATEKAKAFDNLNKIIQGVDLSSIDKEEDEEEQEKDKEEEDSDSEEQDEQEEKDKKGKSKTKATVKEFKKLVAGYKSIEKKLNNMARMGQEDNPEAKVFSSGLAFGKAHTETHCFGIEHDMFTFDKRWNRITAHGKREQVMSDATPADYESFKGAVRKYGTMIASRMAEHHNSGELNAQILATDGMVDYSKLINAGLGEQYVVRRADALIARIISLPSVASIFPMRSNVQDQDLITNAFLGEFSQPYQAGEISKGGVSFEPEKAKVHDVMFKYLIKSFKWIETTYLGYLNTAGSDPIKWNMIEWLILEIAKVLQNERNMRAIQGCRVDPKDGENSHYLSSSTGVLHRLISYVEEYKVLPYTDPTLQDYTLATIGDVFEAFVAEVAEVVENFENKALYVNAKHKPWYLAWYRAKYGKDIDFSGVELKLLNYDLPIIFVPNMGNTKMMWITDKGNIQTLENKPGEMFATSFEQHLESVWAWSVWKEGVAAAYSGRQFSSLEALTASGRKEQAIFINYPAKALTTDATTIDVSTNFLFKSVANTKETIITDLVNAKEGIVYKLEIGDTTNPIQITKNGKFSNIDAWVPTTVGSYIKLAYDAKATKFREVERKIISA